MSRKALEERNKKRIRLVAKWAPERARLHSVLKDPNISEEDFYKAQDQLNRLPRDSSPVRVRNRCAITSRPRAYLRHFGICRNLFKEWALDGKIPGVTKSSW